ncbi:hypothetical protein E2542_SST14467 [Spatholobus suberectus]|nr:hypothetical protein E2542_SST14467 [Spatholobus suberectus]
MLSCCAALLKTLCGTAERIVAKCKREGGDRDERERENDAVVLSGPWRSSGVDAPARETHVDLKGLQLFNGNEDPYGQACGSFGLNKEIV